MEIDPRYLRPTEVDHLLGDPSKIQRKLGWKPKVGFKELVHLMVDHDIELARQEQTLAQAGSGRCGALRMDKSSRIYVAGHRGLVGSAICRRLWRDGYSDLLSGIAASWTW